MIDITVSFNEDVDPSSLEQMNKLPKKIFEWVCYTMNQGGYVPHIYEIDSKSLRFVIRTVAGTKTKLSFQNQIKIASVANHLFKVKQRVWPIAIMRDLCGNQFLDFWKITVTGEPRGVEDHIDREDDDLFEEDDDSTTSYLPESDLLQLPQECSPRELHMS